MSITGGLILFTTIWFMVLLMVLPVRMVSQQQKGEVVPGTPASAPADINMKRKALVTTAISVVVFVVIAAIILYGNITVRDLDWFNRIPADSAGN